MIEIGKIMISGIGILSPIGITCESFFNNLLEEKSIHTIEKDAYSGHGNDKETSRIIDDQKDKIDLVIGDTNLPQTIKYAIYAAKMALKDSGLTSEELANKKVSVIIGSNDSESETFDYYISHNKLDKKYGASYHIAQEISSYFGLHGLSFCVHNACASSNMAVDLALTILRNGESDIVITGGVDSFSIRNYTGFNSLGAISKTGCKPFSRLRDGIMISEGAGIIILEKEADILARGKKAYCEVLGAGSSNDAFHLTQPDKNGIILAIEKGLNDAGITNQDVQYIMVHGTGTIANDQTESSVIKQMFPADSLKGVCSIKGTIGHMMGAAGSVALVAICLIYKKGIIPPSKKSLPLDETCNIKIITDMLKDENIGIFINNSFGFGGNNSILVLGPAR